MVKRWFAPNMNAEQREKQLSGWARAVKRSLLWEDGV